VCLLVVIGVREDGVEELLAVEDGLKNRGLNEPKLVIGDGALAAVASPI
jgi:hypothetical protein